ncbi:hypothetical protein Zmor_012952 [Zophobas morio]|uniref:Uncharacterized protein n=1 Tax=Zophobas morio TaxID=2755281 RepID=A0AA38IC70_9CUCU|nr:hypothetical protein Zmor_012952 [Zophobas morio]
MHRRHTAVLPHSWGKCALCDHHADAVTAHHRRGPSHHRWKSVKEDGGGRAWAPWRLGQVQISTERRSIATLSSAPCVPGRHARPVRRGHTHPRCSAPHSCTLTPDTPITYSLPAPCSSFARTFVFGTLLSILSYWPMHTSAGTRAMHPRKCTTESWPMR